MIKKNYISPKVQIHEVSFKHSVLVVQSIPVKDEPTDATEPDEVKGSGYDYIWDE